MRARPASPLDPLGMGASSAQIRRCRKNDGWFTGPRNTLLDPQGHAALFHRRFSPASIACVSSLKSLRQLGLLAPHNGISHSSVTKPTLTDHALLASSVERLVTARNVRYSRHNSNSRNLIENLSFSI